MSLHNNIFTLCLFFILVVSNVGSYNTTAWVGQRLVIGLLCVYMSCLCLLALCPGFVLQ